MRRTNAFVDPEDSQLVADAKNVLTEPVPYTYTEVTHLGHVKYYFWILYILQRDVILYNLGIGATEKELRWTFEGDDEFSALPTFGVIPQLSTGVDLDWLPNYNPVCYAWFGV